MFSESRSSTWFIDDIDEPPSSPERKSVPSCDMLPHAIFSGTSLERPAENENEWLIQHGGDSCYRWSSSQIQPNS